MLQRFAMVLLAAGVVMTVGCSRSDSGISTAVKAKLAADDTVKASEVNVDTGKQVVTLNGTVKSPAEKDRAVNIARDTKGVTDVVDDITVNRRVAATAGTADQKAETVTDTAHDAKIKTKDAAAKTGEVITDAAITSEVKTKFLAEPGVPGLKINVDTNNGVVTLSGNVTTKAEAAKAVAVARESSGVKRVVNHLHVG